jgi:hypothetical protein
MLFRNPVRTSKRTPYFTITKFSWLMLFKGIIAVYTEKYELMIVKVAGTYSYH